MKLVSLTVIIDVCSYDSRLLRKITIEDIQCSPFITHINTDYVTRMSFGSHNLNVLISKLCYNPGVIVTGDLGEKV